MYVLQYLFKSSMCTTNKKAPAFLLKTYQMLENSDYSHTIHWNEAENGFVIADPNNFAESILPQFFKHKNMHSYIRQLNMYGFSKKRDKNHNYYHHPCFLKNRPELIKEIQRKVQNKGHKRSKESVTSLDARAAPEQPGQILLRMNYFLLLEQAANLQQMINDLQHFPECAQLKNATCDYITLHDKIFKQCRSREEKGVLTAESLVEKEAVEQESQQE